MLRFMALLRCRPAAALIVAAALAVQAFLAGLAGAEGVRIAAPGTFDFAVICHGGGGADPGNAPEPTGAKHPCCLSCTAAAPILEGPPSVHLLPRQARSFAPAVPDTGANVIARRAVRAGLSQAPPSQI